MLPWNGQQDWRQNQYIASDAATQPLPPQTVPSTSWNACLSESRADGAAGRGSGGVAGMASRGAREDFDGRAGQSAGSQVRRANVT